MGYTFPESIKKKSKKNFLPGCFCPSVMPMPLCKAENSKLPYEIAIKYIDREKNSKTNGENGSSIRHQDPELWP